MKYNPLFERLHDYIKHIKYSSKKDLIGLKFQLQSKLLLLVIPISSGKMTKILTAVQLL